VNVQHLRAFLWLRWRLRLNQLKRGGLANAVILGLLAVGAVLLSATLFVGSFLVGLFLLPEASPAALLYVWDGLVVAFLFFWSVGLLADLQRSEALSLEKFLHLPVSLTGAFLINYLSSLFSLNLIVFVPAMVGLSLGLVLARGPALLLLFPLLAGFLLMVTALTHQFQGWLAALMSNPRRRRTVIVLVTAGLILICQLPNLVNMLVLRRGRQTSPAARLAEKQAALGRAYSTQQITAAQYREQLAEIQREHQAPEAGWLPWQQAERTARFVNLVLPPGWLPLGALAAAEGDVLPAVLGALGLTLIGTASLWRSYRTTVRLYTGQFNSGTRRPVAVAPPPPQAGRAPARLLERRLPGLSEHTAAIALSGFRSLTRAPEAKMMLLTPLLMALVFGSMLLAGPMDLPEAFRPLLPFGAMAMILFGMGQLAGNQFGFDRGGFRAFVLCPAPRRDVLLGKNLALAPLALGLGTAVNVLLQAVYPLRWDHFLAALPQSVSMYLLFCLVANGLSIMAPMPVASGTLKPTHYKGTTLLLHLAFFFLFPAALFPALLPLGLEAVAGQLGWAEGAPICLVLSLLELAALGCFYRLALTWQGGWLLARELKVLEVVTTKAE
jgi:hypothetical protein